MAWSSASPAAFLSSSSSFLLLYSYFHVTHRSPTTLGPHWRCWPALQVQLSTALGAPGRRLRQVVSVKWEQQSRASQTSYKPTTGHKTRWVWSSRAGAKRESRAARERWFMRTAKSCAGCRSCHAAPSSLCTAPVPWNRVPAAPAGPAGQ